MPERPSVLVGVLVMTNCEIDGNRDLLVALLGGWVSEFKVPIGPLEFGEDFDAAAARLAEDQIGMKLHSIEALSLPTNVIVGDDHTICVWVMAWGNESDKVFRWERVWPNFVQESWKDPSLLQPHLLQLLRNREMVARILIGPTLT